MKQNKFSIKFVTIKEKNESFGVKSNVNKSGFFLTENRRIFQARLQKMKVSTILLLKSKSRRKMNENDERKYKRISL